MVQRRRAGATNRQSRHSDGQRQPEEASVRLFNLQGCTALVSGGGRGIGKAIALGLAEAGADVAVTARTGSEVEATAAAIAELGVRSRACVLDVSQVAEIPAVVTEVTQQLGPIDILVNCAGINIRRQIQDLEEAEFDQVMNVNFKGAYFMCREVGRGMMERKRGKVVNIASLATGIGLPKMSVYAGSKGAMGQMTKALAVEWASYNIQVNALAPGFIATELNAHMWKNQEFTDWVVDRTPAHRVGTPEDMVGTGLFLASAASDFVTGQVIYVDGGVIAGSDWPL
jgi:NAD(P)-dependent dehydrogenase (short-subunit alcohol dehydrogenase family)